MQQGISLKILYQLKMCIDFAEEKQDPDLKPDAGPSQSSQASDDSAEQLVAVLGGEVSQEAARKLLDFCGGNLQRAVNAHYDSLEGRRPVPHKMAKPAAKPQASPAVQICSCFLPVDSLHRLFGFHGSKQKVFPYNNM